MTTLFQSIISTMNGQRRCNPSPEDKEKILAVISAIRGETMRDETVERVSLESVSLHWQELCVRTMRHPANYGVWTQTQFIPKSILDTEDPVKAANVDRLSRLIARFEASIETSKKNILSDEEMLKGYQEQLKEIQGE